MKIYAFEVRDDETPFFEKIAAEDNIDLVLSPEGLTADRISTLEKGAGVSVLVESEHIGALGLDCMEDEENIVHRDLKTDIFSNRDMAYLRQFKNVIHTRHMAFYTDSAVESMVRCGTQGILEMSEGRPCATRLC